MGEGSHVGAQTAQPAGGDFRMHMCVEGVEYRYKKILEGSRATFCGDHAHRVRGMRGKCVSGAILQNR